MIYFKLYNAGEQLYKQALEEKDDFEPVNYVNHFFWNCGEPVT